MAKSSMWRPASTWSPQKKNSDRASANEKLRSSNAQWLTGLPRFAPSERPMLQRSRPQQLCESAGSRANQSPWRAGPENSRQSKKSMPGSELDRETRIRERAYKLWEENGRPLDRDEDLWQRSEDLIAMEDKPRRGPAAHYGCLAGRAPGRRRSLSRAARQ